MPNAYKKAVVHADIWHVRDVTSHGSRSSCRHEEQIVAIVREAEIGTSVSELALTFPPLEYSSYVSVEAAARVITGGQGSSQS